MSLKTKTLFSIVTVLLMASVAISPALAEGQNGTTLTATVTTAAHWTRTFNWTIDKSVAPDTLDLFRGDQGASTYTIAVTKDGGTDEAWMDGEVCVTNGGAVATVSLAITAVLREHDSQNAPVINTASVDVSGNPVLDPGETGCYAYRVAILNPIAGNNYRVDADVTIRNHSGSLGVPKGPSPAATAVLGEVVIINSSINVDDPNGGPWAFSDSGSVSYSRTFTCDADEGQHGNTATIRETEQSDSASVTVNCYGLEVSKTAQTSFTRTYNWDISKTGGKLDMFRGDTGYSEYLITIDLLGFTDSAWAVNGKITIHNPAPMAATLTQVTDSLGAVVCPALTVPARDDLVCTYSGALSDATTRTNTATATLQNTPSGTTDFSGTAAVVFDEKTTITEVNKSITVIDGNESETFEDDGTWVLPAGPFTCDEDEDVYPNTATIRETSQSATGYVTVNCYALDVTKDAHTSLTRTWTWTIDKVGDKNSLTLSPGQQYLVNYGVTVSAVSADSLWAVNGKITIHNPAPMAATLTKVTDSLGAVVCPALTVPAGGDLVCTYSGALPDAATRTNTATATLQNTPSGTTDFSGTAPVAFGSATITKVDECITVTDDKQGSLGTVCAAASPKTFTYSLYVGPYQACGSYQFINVASFVANTTGATGSDRWIVDVTVPCGGGCTLTPGYWKTHSKYGPAPYDDTWAQLGEDTLFFSSGQSYYQVLWTNPSGGNAYYILAHAYIAAKLNGMNGANTSAVASQLTQAEALFSNPLYTPAYVATLKGSKGNTLRAQFLTLAATLDKYNNGLIGPGHCSE